MASRLDQRLKQAGLLKPGRPVFTVDSQPSSSCSSTENILEEPSYARLAVLNAYPTCPINPPVIKSESNIPEEVFGEEDYANPLDALRMNKKKDAPGSASKLSPYPQTPPGSPQPPESASRLSPEAALQVSPKTSPRRMDPYQSVDDIRMMREKQLKGKGKELDGVKLRQKDKQTKAGKAEARVSQDLDHLCDEETSGYSRPFDALAAHRKRLPTAPESSASSVSLNTTNQFGRGQRSSSAEKLHMNEPSARFLHQVSSSDDPVPADATGQPAQASQNPVLGDKRVRAKSFGKEDRRYKGITPTEGVTENSAGGVNRYILKLEDKLGDLSRGDTGRTCSVGSALNSQTPVKITKLRNGRGRVAILGGKKKDANSSH